MEDATVGWIAAIIIGGAAGWLSEKFMESQMGTLVNLLLGICGGAIASLLLGIFGITVDGWPVYIPASFIGACILIWLARTLQRAA